MTDATQAAPPDTADRRLRLIESVSTAWCESSGGVTKVAPPDSF